MTEQSQTPTKQKNASLKDNKSNNPKHAYWRANLILTLSLLLIWFSVSFGAGILFRNYLDQFYIGGAPLGFWFAQQGSIYVFVILIFVYCFGISRLEKKFGLKG